MSTCAYAVIGVAIVVAVIGLFIGWVFWSAVKDMSELDEKEYQRRKLVNDRTYRKS